PRHVACPRKRGPRNACRVYEGTRACRDHGRHPVPAGIFGLYAHRLTTGEYRDALSLAEKFCTVATETADHSDVPIGSRLIGIALHILGDQPGARRHLEPLVRSRVATARSSHVSLYRTDQRVLLDSYYARVL